LLDGRPQLGISVFAVLGMPLGELQQTRFASFRTVYLPTVSELGERADSSCWLPASGRISPFGCTA